MDALFCNSIKSMGNVLFPIIYVLILNAIGQSDYGQGKEAQGLPLICGHRGGLYKDLPENSFAAIDFTVRNCKSNPVIIEIDVRKSMDRTLFVLHDESIDRTTNGQGRIAALSDVYLKSLFLKDAEGRLTQERIPTFDSLLNYSRDKAIILMLDIKANVWKEVIERLVQEKLIHKTIILTFSPEDSKRVYALSRDVKISCLIRAESDWNAINALLIPTENLIAYVNQGTPQKLIKQLKSNLLMIMADADENAMKNIDPLSRKWYKKFVETRRVDILITDFPVDVSEKLR